nr:nuclear transport factor 2 family protein [uncultured Roseovarius sp.]
MHPTEKTVRQFHESWDVRDPDRGAEVIADDCDFEDIARGEKLPGKDAYKEDYFRWREAFPDGLCKVENVMVSQCGEWATVEFRNTGTHRDTSIKPWGFPSHRQTSRGSVLLGDARQGWDGGRGA